MKLCECGCGRAVSAPTHRFVRGHHWKRIRDQQNIPTEKTCERCAKTYARAAHSNTNHWLNRRFCSEECRRLASGRDPDAMERWCSRCERVLPREAFYKDRTTSDGLTQYCRDCRRAHRKPRSTEQARESNLRAIYGMTPAQYDAMLQEQAGVCAICGQSERLVNYRTGEPYRLAIDHCHDSMEIRGLLCCSCNQALGQMKNDPALLRAAATYLERKRPDATRFDRRRHVVK